MSPVSLLRKSARVAAIASTLVSAALPLTLAAPATAEPCSDVEVIFARPGLGRSLLSAVLARDIPMVTGLALFSALVYILVMALTEAVQRAIDPAGAAS